MCRLKGQKTGRSQKASPEDKLMLEKIFISSDPLIKNFFAKALREEVAAAEERALVRVAQKFSHMLPQKQQVLVERTAQQMALAM